MKTLSETEIHRYERDGFLIVREVVDASFLESLRRESERLWATEEIDEANRRIQWRLRVDGSRTADRIDPILDISPLFSAAVADRRIIGLVAALLHCREPEIFKAKLISKWPGTTGYAMHQDYCYWPGVESAQPGDFMTALLALDPSGGEAGAVELFPGRHHERIPPPPDNPLDSDEALIDLSTGVRAELEPGDMAFFHGMTPHRSGPNRSPHNRQSLFFTYVRPGHEDLTRRYYRERRSDFMDPD